MADKTKKKVVRYQLLPILQHHGLDACGAACSWLWRQDYATFTMAWSSCEDVGWLYWLAECVNPQVAGGLWREWGWRDRPSISTAEQARAFLNKRGVTAAVIEKWLLEYAKKNNCLVVDTRTR